MKNELEQKKRGAYQLLRVIADAMTKTKEYKELSDLRQRALISDIGEVIEKRFLPYGVRIESDAYRQIYGEFAPDGRFICDGHGWMCEG